MEKGIKLKLLEEIESTRCNFRESTDFNHFLLDCKLYLNPSSYGKKIENRWIRENLYKKISKNLDRGDYVDGDKYVEFKVSYKSRNTNNTWSFLQIRPYQMIDRYDLMIIDYKMNYSVYSVPTIEMKKILGLYGEACHGTLKSNMNNDNIEYRITVRENMLHILQPYKFKTTINKFNTKFW